MASGNPGYVFGVFADQTCKTNEIIGTKEIEKYDGTPLEHNFDYKVNGDGSKESLRIAVYPASMST